MSKILQLSLIVADIDQIIDGLCVREKASECGGHDPAFHRPTCRPVGKLRHVGAVQIGMAADYGRIIGELVAQRELQA